MCKVRQIILNLILSVGLTMPFVLSATIAESEQTLCVKVKLEIEQEATLEREAFEAELKLKNLLDLDTLINIGVEIEIKDADGNIANDLFFIKNTELQNIDAIDGTGRIAPLSTAVMKWLIIPSSGAGGTHTEGKDYFCKAYIKYGVDSLSFETETWDERITVKPQPKLILDYMLPGKVYGDDPFTPEIEPPVPFKLGLRVSNVGYGPARNLHIISSQPKIVENVLGLLVDYKIIGSFIGDKPGKNTLGLDFGDIASKKCVMVGWDMICTVSGKFTEFAATFTHSAELGGELTSLIEQINTYFLYEDVLVDEAGRDAILDMLIGTEHDSVPHGIMESDCGLMPIKYVGTPTVTQVAGGLKVITPAPDSWLYVAVNDPYQNKQPNISLVRSDGKVLNSNNYWLANNKIYFVDDGANTTYYIRYAQLDTESPHSTIIPLSPDPTSDNTPSFSGSSTDVLNNIVDIEYRLNGGIWRDVEPFTQALSVKYRFTTPPLSDGMYTVEVRAKDAAGNIEQTAQDSFTIDATPPYTCCQSPAKNATNVAVDTNIVVNIGDATTGVNQSSIVMKVEGTVVSPTITGNPSEYILTYNPAVDFSYSQIVSVEVSAKDLATWPNSLAENYTFTTTLDIDEPNSTITPLFPDPTTDTTPTFTGNAADALSKVVDIEYRVDLGTWTDVNTFVPALNVNYIFTTPALLDGTHTVEVRAEDEVGNVETSYASDKFMVYNPPGTPTIISPANGAKIGTNSVGVEGTGKPESNFLLYVNANQTTTGTISVGGTWTTTVALADGTYTLTARVKDWASNMSPESLGVQIEVDTISPGTPSIISPASGAIIATSTFEVRGTAEANTTYELYVSGSLTATGQVMSTWTATITLRDGAYTLWAIVEDWAGNRSPQSKPISVNVETAPLGTPGITSPADGAAINASTFTVTGTAEANADYTLYINGNPTVTDIASVNGTWQRQVTLVDGHYTLTTTYQDWAGKISPQSLPVRVEVDTRSPATPTITSPTDGAAINTADFSVSGTGEANTTYTLYVNGTPTATGAVLANGIWQTLLTLADGTYSLRAVVKDRAGNFSSQSQPTLIEIDTIPPGTPTITSPAAGTAISTSTFRVAGTGEPNAVCAVYVDSVPVGTCTVASDGTWQMLITLIDGSYTLTCRVEDRASNLSPESSGVRIEIDTVPPGIPIITSPLNNAVIGTSNLEVQGTGEDETTYTLYANGSLTATGSVSAEGVWQAIITLSDGPYDLSCRVKDRAGNQSLPSLVTAIKVETSPPGTPSITSPLDGAVIGTSTFEVVGSAEPDTNYTLYVNGSPTATGNVSGTGTWQTTVTLDEGTHNLTVIVEDWVGNQSPQSSPIAVVIDTTPPGSPTITSPENGELIGIISSFRVEGEAEANTSYRLYVDGSLTATGSVTAEGKWEGRINLEDGSYTLMARVKDRAGNLSPQSAGVRIVLDTTPPADIPTIISPTEGAIIRSATFEVSGTGEPNTFWVLYVDGRLYTSGAVASTWTTTITISEGSHTLSCRLRDEAYNFGTMSSEVRINVSTPPGTPGITSPTDGSIIATSTFEVQGTGETKTTFILYANGSQIASGSVSTGGTWLTTISLLDGTYSLTAKLKDTDGNLSPQSSKVSVQVDTTPPYTCCHSPRPNATDEPVNTNIVVHVKDAVTGVDQSTIVMKVGVSTVIPAIDGTPQDYTLTYDPPFDFDYSEIVNVVIDARDMASNTLHYVYSFIIQPSPGTQSSITIYPGWNLIALPLKPEATYTAESLGDEMNRQGAKVERIQSWDGSGWLTHLINKPFGDFDIEISKGYFVLNNNYSTWQISGAPIHTLAIGLNPGWNLIGLPLYVSILVDTAESMGDEINTQGGGCTQIQSWDGSGWQTHLINMPFGDFDVSQGNGYFVYATKSSTWSPNQIEITSLTQTQVTISWKTSEDCSTQINYGTTTVLGNTAYDDRGSNTKDYNHFVTLTDLQPNTTYYYEIMCGGVIDNNHGKYYSVTTKGE